MIYANAYKMTYLKDGMLDTIHGCPVKHGEMVVGNHLLSHGVAKECGWGSGGDVVQFYGNGRSYREVAN